MRNSLTDKIAQAIGDPGSVLARGENETVTRWSTRAVEAVLGGEDRAADAAEQAYVDRMLAETGLAGMDIHDGSARLSLVLAHDLAAKMTLAFKTILDAQPGAENYVEQEVIERNGGGRYVFIVCKPDGKTPHQLRRAAEADLDKALSERDDLHEIADNLAHAIASITGGDIGEHSSANDPWQNALDAAEDYVPNGVTSPYSAPGMPAGAPERAREIAETMPTVGRWSGPDHSPGAANVLPNITCEIPGHCDGDNAQPLGTAPQPPVDGLMKCGHPIDWDDDDLGCRGCSR